MEFSPNRAFQHLEILTKKIGCRPIGSQENNDAAIYISKILENTGLEVELQEFEIPSWKAGSSFLSFNGEHINVRPNPFSNPFDITAEVIPFYSLDQLQSAPDLTGKIALLLGELTKENLTAKGFTIYNPEHHQTLIRLIEQKNPSSIIMVRLETENDSPIINDWDFDIPSITIPPEIALRLHQENSPYIHIKIDSSRNSGKTKNIIGRRKGIKEEKIILSAHYDTVFNTAGAFDNASGVSVLLALAEQIAPNTQLETSFEFTAFSSEEYIGVGDRVYMDQNKGNLDTALVAMNFDGIGQTLGTNNITLMAGSEDLEQQLKFIKKEFPAVQWTNPWYESNHFTYFSNGIPSIPFSSCGVSNLLHTKNDQIQWISPEKLNEVQSFAFSIIRTLQDKSASWTRPI